MRHSRSVLLVALSAPIARAQTTECVSIATNNSQALNSFEPSISANGRYVAFSSDGPHLVPGDTNGLSDVFLRDRVARTTERVSLSSTGAQANDHCHASSVSAGGRVVAFDSRASNLVPGGAGVEDVYVRDRRSGTTERVSLSTAGVAGDRDSFGGALSADGRFVAFQSNATNLVPGDLNAWTDVFVRDRLAGITERVSVSTAGVEGDGPSYSYGISADGRYVAFVSQAGNLAANDGNGSAEDVFVRDRLLGTTELVSRASSGAGGNGGSTTAAISEDGRFVAFSSDATDLVPGDTNGATDVFVRDREAGTTERVSVSTAGVEGNRGTVFSVAISGDGRCVAFDSLATNLADGDTNLARDVFVRDRVAGTTTRASVATGGAQGNDASGFECTISADGRFVAFESVASNLAAGDSNAGYDAFVHDLDTSVLALLCEPSFAGVKICPCANPPSGPGRGCDNSAATGGATLSGAGSASLSADDVVFTTDGEKPGAFSILVQGDAFVPAGAVYGQGVRCVGGSQKRLFKRTAIGQGITAPDFAAGDPPISVRSAAKGDPIAPGERRWYFVCYRDPVVLGGCAASSTFNATTTRQATWAP